MAYDHEYICNGCGTAQKRSNLIVKKVTFAEMGEGSSTIRSRVIAWLCHNCVSRDAEWHLPPHRTPAERAATALKRKNGEIG
jgi:hypothetical protein